MSFTTTFDMAIEGDSEAMGRLDVLSGKIQQAGAKTDDVKAQTASFTSTLEGSAIGISAAASSATSLYFQYDNLEKNETRVDQVERALTTSKANLITAQTRLSELVSKGITSGTDYEKARLQLKAANNGLQIPKTRLSKRRVICHKRS